MFRQQHVNGIHLWLHMQLHADPLILRDSRILLFASNSLCEIFLNARPSQKSSSFLQKALERSWHVDTPHFKHRENSRAQTSGSRQTGSTCITWWGSDQSHRIWYTDSFMDSKVESNELHSFFLYLNQLNGVLLVQLYWNSQEFPLRLC